MSDGDYYNIDILKKVKGNRLGRAHFFSIFLCMELLEFSKGAQNNHKNAIISFKKWT